eukprot:5366012-Pyramimonas_sp.AAC.1
MVTKSSGWHGQDHGIVSTAGRSRQEIGGGAEPTRISASCAGSIRAPPSAVSRRSSARRPAR